MVCLHPHHVTDHRPELGLPEGGPDGHLGRELEELSPSGSEIEQIPALPARVIGSG